MRVSPVSESINNMNAYIQIMRGACEAQYWSPVPSCHIPTATFSVTACACQRLASRAAGGRWRPRLLGTPRTCATRPSVSGRPLSASLTKTTYLEISEYALAYSSAGPAARPRVQVSMSMSTYLPTAYLPTPSSAVAQSTAALHRA